jgi:hypothetical protein
MSWGLLRGRPAGSVQLCSSLSLMNTCRRSAQQAEAGSAAEGGGPSTRVYHAPRASCSWDHDCGQKGETVLSMQQRTCTVLPHAAVKVMESCSRVLRKLQGAVQPWQWQSRGGRVRAPELGQCLPLCVRHHSERDGQQALLAAACLLRRTQRTKCSVRAAVHACGLMRLLHTTSCSGQSGMCLHSQAKLAAAAARVYARACMPAGSFTGRPPT